MKLRIVLFTAVLVSGPNTPASAAIRMEPTDCPVSKGADVALKVVGAAGEMDGVASEYHWLAANRPGWQVAGQAEMRDAGRNFDILTIARDGKSASVCFDISDFFGKMDLPK